MLTFLDTDVLMNAFRGSDELSRKAFEIIEDPNREFVISDYLVLELIPKPSYFKMKEELEFYQAYINAASVHIPLSADSASDAISLACRHGLSALDALHVSAARSAGAELVTAEKGDKPYFRVTEITVRTIRS